jgi:non-homologous end joining protein Ku
MSGWDFDLLKKQKPEVIEAMKVLGNAGPTVNNADKLVKGYRYDENGGGKVYYSSDDLVRIADGMIEVAKWLDTRAMSDGAASETGVGK